MKSTNSKIENDMRYGQSIMIVTTPDDDIKHNKDYFIGNFGVAWRKRRINFTRYRQISIRYKRYLTTKKTEFQKLLDAECQSQLYVFEFADCYVICKVDDIIRCLKNNQYQVVDNEDFEGTMACYINITDIEQHLKVNKDAQRS